MAAAILPDEGIAEQLAYILSVPIVGVLPWELMLWTNDYEPSTASVLSDLVEATFLGYSRRTLSRDGWTTPSVDVGCCSSTWGIEPQRYTVEQARGETVYGLAYVDVSSGVLRWIQRFEDADINPLQDAQVLQFLPLYTLTSSECATTEVRRRKASRAKQRNRLHG